MVGSMEYGIARLREDPAREANEPLIAIVQLLISECAKH